MRSRIRRCCSRFAQTDRSGRSPVRIPANARPGFRCAIGEEVVVPPSPDYDRDDFGAAFAA